MSEWCLLSVGLYLFSSQTSHRLCTPAKHHKPFHQTASRKTPHVCSRQSLLSDVCFTKTSSHKTVSRKHHRTQLNLQWNQKFPRHLPFKNGNVAFVGLVRCVLSQAICLCFNDIDVMSSRNHLSSPTPCTATVPFLRNKKSVGTDFQIIIIVVYQSSMLSQVATHDSCVIQYRECS